MTQLTNSFEGGTDTSTVTTAGSGGASGNAFDAVVIGTAGTAAWSSTHAAHGTLGAKISTGASGTATYVEWNTSEGTTTTIYLRAYIYFTANPGAQFNWIRLQNGGATCAQIRITTAGKIALLDSAGTAQGTSTNAIGLNQWVRVELQFVASATTGSMQLKLFNTPDSTTPTETLNSTANINTGTQFTKYQFGIVVNTANVVAFWLDDIGIDSAGYLGPAAANATATPSAVAAVAAVPSPTESAGATSAPSAVAAVGAVPAPTESAAASTAPSTVAALAAVPSPTQTAGASTVLSAVAAVAAIPAPTETAGATVAPSPVAAVAAIPATVDSGGDTTTPSTVAALASIPSPAVSAGATVASATVGAIAAVPDPSVIAQAHADVTVTLTTVSVSAAVLSVSAQAAATATLTTVAGVAAFPELGYIGTPVPFHMLVGLPSTKWAASVAMKWLAPKPSEKWDTGEPRKKTVTPAAETKTKVGAPRP